MKKLFTSLGLLLLSVLLAFPVGAAWWGLWMNRGYIGAPGILPKLQGASGESYYDAMQDEMTLIAWLVICACLFVTRFLLMRRRRAATPT
jgi:hypothetical protein